MRVSASTRTRIGEKGRGRGGGGEGGRDVETLDAVASRTSLMGKDFNGAVEHLRNGLYLKIVPEHAILSLSVYVLCAV